MTGSNDGLPDGWVITTLGDARLDLSKSIDPRKSGAEMFELYSVPSFSHRWPEIVPGNTVGSSKRTVETNAVLLCKINPRINRVWIVGDYSHHQKIASTEWLSFFQISELDPGYLCYSLQQHEFRDYLAANASGVGGSLMRVRGTAFADYPLPLPPLPEQHRIVAEVEKQFTRLDASVAALKRVQANLKRYRASVLKAACEGKLVPTEVEVARAEGRDYEPASVLLERVLAERRDRWESQEKRRGRHKEPIPPETSNLPELPEGWVWATAAQLLARSEYGTSVKCSYESGGLPVLRIPNIVAGELDLIDIKYATRPVPIDAEAALAKGDVLMCRTNGSVSLVGKTAVVNTELEPYHSFASYLLRFRLIEAEIMPKWFHIYATSQLGRDFIEQNAASSAGQNNVSLSLIHTMPVPFPPLAEQFRIVAEAERRLSVIQQAEATVEANLTRAERLRQSILKQAFSGKLVPQDPNDEPASVLLERILAERETAQAAAKPKSRAKRRRAKSSPERQLVLGVQEGAS